MENELISTEKLEQLIVERKVKEVRNIFEVVPTIDIAEACDDFEDISHLVFIFKFVKSEYTADLFTELSNDTKEKLIQMMSDSELANILESQFTDDLVDDLEDLPANLVTRVLRNVSKEKREVINKLLNYKENTAGSIMTTEFLVLLESLTADEAIRKIRREGKTKETIYTIFIIDSKRNLVGTLDLDDLIFAKADEIISDIMNRDYVTTTIGADQEEVANLIKRYDLNAIAVLNNENRLIGLITVDDIVDVIEQEATEDMTKMAGVAPLDNSYLETNVFRMALKCAPWLMVLLVLGTFSSMILSKFETTLSALPILVPFVTVLMDTGGNAGGQTTTLMVRGLAVQEFGPKDYFKILWKEMRVALVTGLMVCVFAALWFLFEMYVGIIGFDGADLNNGVPLVGGELFVARLSISLLVSGTLLLGILVAKFVGTSLPMLVAAFKKDPALISSPFVTTIVDVCSLLIYIGLATIVFNTILG